MQVVATLWWVGFLAAVGLCLGSYFNVVIFRVPRGISTTSPLWSFCPCCEARIHWYDNLPVLSYIHLGGRCRSCGARISARYPAVELLMAMVVLIMLDAFCISGLRGTGGPLSLGITEQLHYDWPIVLAHVILFGCFLAMSAIDLEHYFIDIRFTNLAVLAGFVLHMLWTPEPTPWRSTIAGSWYRPGVVFAAVGVAAALAVVVTVLILRFLQPPTPDGELETEGVEPDRAPSGESASSSAVSLAVVSEDLTEPPAQLTTEAEEPLDCPSELDPHSQGPLFCTPGAAAWLLGVTFVLVAATAIADGVTSRPLLLPSWRMMVPLAACFFLIVGAGAAPRSSDTEIVEAIEAERFSARGVALRELLALVPALLAGGAVAWLAMNNEAFRECCAGIMEWSIGRSWRPFTGLATAAVGFVVGGGLGWAVRIGFTLVLGREAFGTGDIHLMAAAGCVAGWPVVVIGFVLTSFLALAGWVATLPFKRTRAIPLVPWLSLAFLAVVVFYEPLRRLGAVQNTVDLFEAVVSGKLTALAH
ncbi:MAG: hypothetical protein GY842_08365 [bacterium]|nr:hypothetical protein [bacterium]